MTLDSPSTVLPCTACGAGVVGGFGIWHYLPCQNGRRTPCAERLAAVAKLDQQVARDLLPPDFPVDAWSMVVDAVVVASRGPTGLPMGGGVLQVLFGQGVFRAAVAYFAERRDGLPFTARAAMRRRQIGKDCSHVFDAIDVYFARAHSPACKPEHRADAESGVREQVRRRNSGVHHPPASPRAADSAFFREVIGGTLGGGVGTGMSEVLTFSGAWSYPSMGD